MDRMSGSPYVVTYEVHVRKRGRWQIHATFTQSQQASAIAEGRMLETIPTVDAVKVVREVHDPRLGSSHSSIVYKAGKIEDENDGGRGEGAEKTRRGDPVDQNGLPVLGEINSTAKAPPARRRGLGGMDTIPKILVVIGVSLLAATIFAGVIGTIMGHSLGSVLSGQILFGLFVGMFLLSAISTLHVVFFPANRKRPPPRAEIPKAPAVGAAIVSLGGSVSPVEEKSPSPLKLDPDLPINVAVALTQAVRQGISLLPKLYFHNPPFPPKPSLEPSMLMDFLAVALGGLAVRRMELDNFSRFGANLFLAGAGEVLVRERGVREDAARDALVDCIISLGIDKGRAQAFSTAYQDYLMADPRYMHMFQSGGAAMRFYLENAPTAAGKLEEALGSWSTPKSRDQEDPPVTVLFTDLIGTAELAASAGDAAVQEVIRAHNRLVRAALQQFQGKEVKFTGNGIMASFPTVSGGVEAAIALQRAVAGHNRENPGTAIRVRAGLNAGDVITENDDLFGTTVQVAARICNMADPGDILVHEIVQGLLAGRGLRFVDRGRQVLKGVAAPVGIFQVLWDDSPVPTRADQPPADLSDPQTRVP